jgi:hypothetical protein
MDLHELVKALLRGDVIGARQWVADAQRIRVDWQRLEQPKGLAQGELVVAAALVELFAQRSNAAPPPWSASIGASREAIILDPGLPQMPRSFARAKREAPEPLRKRNLVALPGFLEVA